MDIATASAVAVKKVCLTGGNKLKRFGGKPPLTSMLDVLNTIHHLPLLGLVDGGVIEIGSKDGAPLLPEKSTAMFRWLRSVLSKKQHSISITNTGIQFSSSIKQPIVGSAALPMDFKTTSQTVPSGTKTTVQNGAFLVQIIDLKPAGAPDAIHYRVRIPVALDKITVCVYLCVLVFS